MSGAGATGIGCAKQPADSMVSPRSVPLCRGRRTLFCKDEAGRKLNLQMIDAIALRVGFFVDSL